jgi:hypothetical protein
MTVISAPAISVQPDVDFRNPRLRLSGLLDPGSAVPAGVVDDCGVTLMTGRIDGAPVVAFCTDATTMGGALGAAGADRIVEATELAVGRGWPVLGFGTAAAPGSPTASSPWMGAGECSVPCRPRPERCRRSPSSWDRQPAQPRTDLPSPTSS